MYATTRLGKTLAASALNLLRLAGHRITRWPRRGLVAAGLAGLLGWQLIVAGPALAKAGNLDPTFGTGGKVTTALGIFDGAQALAVQTDGKLVAAGSAFTGTNMNFALARYNPDGTLDTSFGTGGTVTTNMCVGYDLQQVRGLVTQGTKLVAAGSAFTGSSWDFAVARYRSSSALDNSFGTGGKVTTDFAANSDTANALALQADGKVVAAGSSNAGSYDHFALARYVG